jgi:hypothetical protein
LGIATGIDMLLDIVQEEKEISVKEAAAKLNVSEKKIETWSRILADEGLLELVYPANPLKSPSLRIMGFKKEKKKKKDKKKKEEPKKKKKQKTLKKEKRSVKGFASRFKRAPKYKTYEEKKEGLKEKKPSKRKTQVILLIAIIVIIVILLMVFGGFEWLRNLVTF